MLHDAVVLLAKNPAVVACVPAGLHWDHAHYCCAALYPTVHSKVHENTWGFPRMHGSAYDLADHVCAACLTATAFMGSSVLCLQGCHDEEGLLPDQRIPWWPGGQ